MTSVISDLLTSRKARLAHHWQKVRDRSDEYVRALGIRPHELEFDVAVRVSTEFGNILIVGKNTCGGPYGAEWTYLLQARAAYREMAGVGGGITFISVLNEDEHVAVIEGITRGRVSLVEEHVWP